MNKQDILKAYNFRQAIKEFKDEKISKEDFNFILETGRLSPSAFGWEPWHFLVVQDPKIREELKEVTWGAQNSLPTASHFVVVLARKPKEMVVGSEYFKYMSKEVYNLPEEVENMRYEVFDKFQKEDFDLTDDRKIFDWTSKQTYIALGNMMSSAAMIGIDSCPIEGFDKSKVEEVLVKHSAFDSSEFGVSVMVAFGYRVKDLDWPKSRQEVTKVISYL